MMLVVNLIALAVLGATLPAFAGFRPIETVATEAVEGHLPGLRKLGVRHRVVKRVLAKPGDVRGHTYEVSLGSLDEESCRRLKSSFYDDGIECRSKTGRPSDLGDFLPPLVQATVGLSYSALIGEPSGNCWGTVYEYLRLQQIAARTRNWYAIGDEYKVFWVEESRVRVPLTGDRDTTPVATVESPEQLARLAPTLRLGDVLLVLDETGQRLVHAAIHIDGEYFFEKPDFGGGPIHIGAFGPDIFATYGKNGRYQIRRLRKDAPQLADLSPAARDGFVTVPLRVLESGMRWVVDGAARR